MKNRIILLISALFVVTVFTGCNKDNDAKDDTDTDSDTTVSSDEDTNADSDTSSDSETEETYVDPGVPDKYVAVDVPLAEWVATEDTTLGIQGAWYHYFDNGGSTITNQADFFETDGKLCVAGEGAEVLNEEYGTYWGAGVGLDVCNTGATGTPKNVKYALSTCQYGEHLDRKIVGVSFIVTGTIPNMPLRVQYSETSRNNNAYTEVRKEGRAISLFKDAYVKYDATQGDINVSKIESIQLQIPTAATGPMPFDFCISDFVVLTVTEYDTDPVVDSDSAVDSDTAIDTDTATDSDSTVDSDSDSDSDSDTDSVV